MLQARTECSEGLSKVRGRVEALLASVSSVDDILQRRTKGQPHSISLPSLPPLPIPGKAPPNFFPLPFLE